MPFQQAPLNPRESLIQLEKSRLGQPSDAFLIYMRGVRDAIGATAQGFDPVQVTGRTSSIGTTAIPTDNDLSEGLYRVDWYLQVEVAAGVSSSVQLTLSWTRNGITQQLVGTLVNGNTTATNKPESAPLIHIDAGSPISYAVAYASNPGSAMAFGLDLVLSRVALL